MMKKVLIAILVITLITSICTVATSEAYIPSEIKNQNIYLVPQDYEQLQTILANCLDEMNKAHAIADVARNKGYDDSSAFILEAKKIYNSAKADYDYYYNTYNQSLYEKKIKQEEEALWTVKQQEYPNATFIWRYFKDCGYNDYVIAGILGNIMAEVGGQTLNIQYWLKGNGYYGMCQWSNGYKGVWGAELKEQCDFLQNSIRYEMDTFGFCYKKGFNYDSFCSLTDEKDAALMFAKCYERCASFSYSQRQQNATKALNYFTN